MVKRRLKGSECFNSSVFSENPISFILSSRDATAKALVTSYVRDPSDYLVPGTWKTGDD